MVRCVRFTVPPKCEFVMFEETNAIEHISLGQEFGAIAVQLRLRDQSLPRAHPKAT